MFRNGSPVEARKIELRSEAMFESELESKGFSAGLLVFQLFAVPPLCLVSSFALLLLIEKGTSNEFASNLLGYLLFAGVGTLYGSIVQTKFPRAVESGGRWIWVPPVGLLTWGVVFDLARGRATDLANWFAPSTNSGNGEAAHSECFFSRCRRSVAFAIRWPSALRTGECRASIEAWSEAAVT